MLELGRAGSQGVGKGVVPVLRDGAVVATLEAAKWREAATARVGDRTWEFAKRARELTGRRAEDPEDSARFRARQTSFWKGTWVADVDDVALAVETVSMWTSAHRYLRDGREIGRSGTGSGWLRLPTLTLEDSVGLDAQVFLLWVELVLRRRAASAAGAGGVAAAGAVG